MKRVFGIWTTLPRALPYVRPYRGLGVLTVLFTIAAAAVALAEPWPLAILVDSVLGDRDPPGFITWLLGGTPGTYGLLLFVVLAGLVLTFLTNGITVLADWTAAKLEQRMVLDLRSDLFNHCQRLSLTFHDARLTGQLMQQINLQAAAIGVIMTSFPPIFQALLTLVGMFVVTALISWKVAIAALIAVPFIWWSLGLYGTRIVPRLQRVQSLEWKSLSIVHEAMGMLRVIVAFGREKHEFQKFRSQGEVAVEERIKVTVRQTLFSLAVTTATAFGAALVMGVAAVLVIRKEITVGELLVLVAYVAAMYQPLEQISSTIGEMNDRFVQFNSSIDLLLIEPEVKEAPDAIDIGRSSGEVTFENVGFAYKDRQDTLKDISFTAPAGQRVAIVGPTGAGKTTLMNLLVRYYDPQAGRIMIDGVDIRQIKIESLREQFSVVLQEPVLFSGTIAENIRYGKLDAPMDEVIAAAKAANAHDFIERQPQGYETVLGERGAQLSGGERQRIAVARAFIKNAPILVLDEPTSSIDSKTEDVILDALEELMEGRTSFMVAHRLSTVRDADLILVLRDGQIVEQGSHDELIAGGGIYHELHEAQTRVRRRRPGKAVAPATVNGHAGGEGRTAEPPPIPLLSPPPPSHDGYVVLIRWDEGITYHPFESADDAEAFANEAREPGGAPIQVVHAHAVYAVEDAVVDDFDAHEATAGSRQPPREPQPESRDSLIAAGDFDALAGEPKAPDPREVEEGEGESLEPPEPPEPPEDAGAEEKPVVSAPVGGPAGNGSTPATPVGSLLHGIMRAGGAVMGQRRARRRARSHEDDR